MNSNLITDRTQADAAYLRTQREKILNEGWAALSEAEQMEYLAGLKGGYNTTDLNRVTHAMEYLVERIRSYGYTVKHEKVKVPHQPQKGTSRLPVGYTELEYIESTGTQYMKTGVFHNANTCPSLRMVLDAELIDSGAIIGTAAYQSFYVGTLGGYIYYSTHYADVSTALAYQNNTRLKYDLNNELKTFSVYSNDTSVLSVSTNVGVPTGNRELYLFGYNTSDSGTANPSKAKIYACQFYQNGTLVRDFIPCKNPSNAVGLYDIANGVFYGNAGTGAFTAGGEVELPPVEILDDYTWYHSDIPQAQELTAYLQNVKWLREAMVLLPNTPEVPDDMEGFTFAEANDIEKILVIIETVINLMVDSFIYGGEIFSGEVI